MITIVAGGISEAYIPSKLIVPNDAAATAASFLGSEQLFRIGFAFYLVEAVCDNALALLFYLTRNFLLVLTPEYASNLFLLPAVISAFCMAVWLTFRGVNVAKREEKVNHC